MDNFESYLDEAYDSGDDYEICWEHGAYDGQYCPCCPHRGECSGADDED